jgi:hypothetical protein
MKYHSALAHHGNHRYPPPVRECPQQNQLYLRVPPPSGAALDGALQAFPNAQNNVQRVIVTTPVAGTYQVQVHGVSVTVNSPVLTNPGVPKQDFAVVASNVLNLTVADRAGSGFGGLR